MKLILHVTYHCASRENAEAFLNESNAAGIPDITRAEEGCLAYDFFFPEKGNDLLLVEKWESDELQAVHVTKDHIKKLQGIKAKYVESVTLEKFREA